IRYTWTQSPYETMRLISFVHVWDRNQHTAESGDIFVDALGWTLAELIELSPCHRGGRNRLELGAERGNEKIPAGYRLAGGPQGTPPVQRRTSEEHSLH